MRELCRPEAIEILFAAAGQKRAGRAAWNLLLHALWRRHHIERAIPPPDAAAALAGVANDDHLLTLGRNRNCDEQGAFAMEFPQSSVTPLPSQHAQISGERCPYCDQPIRNEKAREIRSRMEAEQRERTEALTAQLSHKFMEQQTQAVAAARGESREAYETDKKNAVNAINAKHFLETQKLTDKLDDLKRQLEKKTAEELGEGAEIDLIEALKEEFPDDRIERVGKGEPGADIRHVVIHNRNQCGTIIYDSKNRRRWLDDYVDKLARDQRADKADHAILSTLKFPAGTRELHEKGGVIIANPARVVAVVRMLRKHIVHVHTLRLSITERATKTVALYNFMTSERCTQLLAAIDTQAEELLGLQEKEKKAHDATWKRQGTLYRSIQKVRGELCSEIDSIIEAE